MLGKEAQEILDDLNLIKYCLTEADENLGFYHLGVMSERMRQIVAVDMVSFKPTVKKEEDEMLDL